MSEVWNRFGPTAAWSHAKRGRTVRPSSMTIDVHSHVAMPEAANFVKPHLEIASMPLVNFATPDTRALNQHQDADRTSRMTKYDERFADLEEMGVDLQVVKPLPPQCYYTLPIEIAGMRKLTGPRDYQLLAFNGKLISGSGRQHSEWPIHAQLMQSRPNANVSIHTHAEWPTPPVRL